MPHVLVPLHAAGRLFSLVAPLSWGKKIMCRRVCSGFAGLQSPALLRALGTRVSRGLSDDQPVLHGIRRLITRLLGHDLAGWLPAQPSGQGGPPRPARLPGHALQAEVFLRPPTPVPHHSGILFALVSPCIQSAHNAPSPQTVHKGCPAACLGWLSGRLPGRRAVRRADLELRTVHVRQARVRRRSIGASANLRRAGSHRFHDQGGNSKGRLLYP